ncbi:hypothetical protein BIV60_06900 [Bacillus sp. MUM 116]|nr:hypothetical protein BIV60_06900 [Bacillus sp. MUM 116]
MFLRKDATKHFVIRVDELIRKTTIYAKIVFEKGVGTLKAFQFSISSRYDKISMMKIEERDEDM